MKHTNFANQQQKSHPTRNNGTSSSTNLWELMQLKGSFCSFQELLLASWATKNCTKYEAFITKLCMLLPK